MAFPQDPLDIRNELLIDGTWVECTSNPNGTRGSSGVKIRRGYGAEQATNISAGSCDFVLDNRDGTWTNRNPLSDHFGKLGPNTQFRSSVAESACFLKFADYNNAAGTDGDGATCSTADKAVISITGDIDIRIDIEPDQWRPVNQMLAAKYATAGDQRSWALYTHNQGRRFQFVWSSDGTSGGRLFAGTTVDTPDDGRLAIRVTLDVNNGAGGNTVTFYTSTSINGSWTQLGDTVIQSGVTSIFDSNVVLEVGNQAGGTRGTSLSTIFAYTGKVYAFELRNGIAGTLVADMDPSTQTRGTTSWSDGLGTPNTWALTQSAEITDADYRFWGEVPEFPTEWDPTATDVTVKVHAGELWERLNTGAKPLNSAIYRNLRRYLTTTGITSWHPCEDGSDSTQISPVRGRAGYLRDASFSTDTALPGTAGVLLFSSDNGYASANGDTSSGITGIDYVLFYFKLPAIPASSVVIHTTYHTAGTVFRVQFGATATTYTLTAVNASGTTVFTSNTNFGSGAEPDNQWIAMRLKMTQSGANISWEWAWYPVGAPVLYGTSSTAVGTVGKPRSWISYEFTGKLGFSLAHVVLARADLGFEGSDFTSSTNGYVGETVIERWERLNREEGHPCWVIGNREDTTLETMGAQRAIALPALHQEIVDLDGGLIFGPRDKFGLTLRLRNSFTNRKPLALNYAEDKIYKIQRPDEGIVNTRNDITVRRPSGGFASSVRTTGPRNTSSPTAGTGGVGVYDEELSRNAELDTRLQALADDATFRGTWDELRYAGVEIHLSRSAITSSSALLARVRHLDLGDVVSLVDLPTFLPRDDVLLLIRGISETLLNREQIISLNTVPYGPYRVNDLTESDESVDTIAGTFSALNAGITSSASSFDVKTTDGPLWTTGTGLALPVKIGGDNGELITVGTIAGASSPQTFSVVTRSVNGVIRTWDADDSVDVAYPFYVSL